MTSACHSRHRRRTVADECGTQRAAAGQRDVLRVVDRVRPAAAPARRRGPRRPSGAAELRRQVHHHGAVGGGHGGRQGRRGVHHEHVARAQEAVEVGGPGVGEAARGSLGDEHPHVVAAAAFGLHRVVGDELRWHLDVEDPLGEVERGHHATSSGAGTSDAR